MESKGLYVAHAGDQREEVGRAPIPLRAQDPPEPLRLLLARAERARYLDEHVGIGQVDGEVPHLRQHDALQRALTKVST